MAAKTYLALDAAVGRFKRMVATIVSAGAANAGDIVALDDDGLLDLSVFPASVLDTTPLGSAGGDLADSYPNPTVAKIRNRAVAGTLPTDGQVLTWDNANSTWKPATAGGGAPSGSAGGDLSGTYPNPTVAKLEGRVVSAAAPSLNDVLTWTGAQWEAAAAGTAPEAGAANQLFLWANFH